MNEKILEILKNSPIFCKAEKNNLLHVLNAGSCVETEYPQGARIVLPDGFGKCVGIIFSGNAKVYSNDGDRNVLLRRMRERDVFGVATLFGCDDGEISSIVAGRGCKILFISRLAVEKLLELDNAFMYEYISFLSGRIRFLNRKIAFYTSGSAERRVALYLSSFGSDQIEADLPMNSLCELLDIGRASLYRAFDKLTDDGFIIREGDKITIVNRQAMLDCYKINN